MRAQRIVEGVMTADSQEEVTVFLIGMRINSFLRPSSWVPPLLAMPRMLRELSNDPSSGFLGYRLLLRLPREPYVVQYWASPEQLLAYASDPKREHQPAWAAFNRRLRKGGTGVGFWHETYQVPAGSHEQVYVNMPPSGLAAARGEPIPIERRGRWAAQRLAARRAE